MVRLLFLDSVFYDKDLVWCENVWDPLTLIVVTNLPFHVCDVDLFSSLSEHFIGNLIAKSDCYVVYYIGFSSLSFSCVEL